MENNYNLNLNLNLNYYIILLRVIHGWVQHKIKMKINELAAKSMRILNGVNEHFESWLNSVQLYEIDRNAIGKGLFCCCVKKCHSVCQFWSTSMPCIEHTRFVGTRTHPQNQMWTVVLSICLASQKTYNQTKRRRFSGSHTINTQRLCISICCLFHTTKRELHKRKKYVRALRLKLIYTACIWVKMLSLLTKVESVFYFDWFQSGFVLV